MKGNIQHTALNKALRYEKVIKYTFLSKRSNMLKEASAISQKKKTISQKTQNALRLKFISERISRISMTYGTAQGATSSKLN
jgi:hypothetical protein